MTAKSPVAKKFKIGVSADFITSEDLTQASEFEREVNRLLRHQADFVRDIIKKRFEDAASAYTRSATDENFAALKSAGSELTLLEVPTPYQRIRSFTHQVVRDFADARFVPWARAIVERGLAKARAGLAEVIASERTHHFEVTGEELGEQPNAIVEKARLPVRELEHVLQSISDKGNGGLCAAHDVFNFIKFLHARTKDKQLD